MKPRDESPVIMPSRNQAGDHATTYGEYSVSDVTGDIRND
jgi:hypothetical protein